MLSRSTQLLVGLVAIAGRLPAAASAMASASTIAAAAAGHGGTLLGHECPSGYQIRGSCVPRGMSPLDFYVNHVHDEQLPPPRVTQTLTSAGGCALTVLN